MTGFHQLAAQIEDRCIATTADAERGALVRTGEFGIDDLLTIRGAAICLPVALASVLDEQSGLDFG